MANHELRCRWLPRTCHIGSRIDAGRILIRKSKRNESSGVRLVALKRPTVEIHWIWLSQMLHKSNSRQLRHWTVRLRSHHIIRSTTTETLTTSLVCALLKVPTTRTTATRRTIIQQSIIRNINIKNRSQMTFTIQPPVLNKNTQNVPFTFKNEFTVPPLLM